MRLFPFVWLTIKQFYTDEHDKENGEWWAKAGAEELLNVLNQEEW